MSHAGRRRPDVRVCCVGDSYTQGVGDRDGGWVGRLAARAVDRGHRLTAYNLGVRRETSADVAGRWFAEAEPRLAGGDAHGVVFAFGLNDSTHEDGRPRVPRGGSIGNLGAVVDRARGAGWPVLVIGIPPIPDGEDGRDDLAGLEAAYREKCAAMRVPFVPVHAALRDKAAWWASIEEYDDGAHCGPDGHRMLADVIDRAGWRTWLDALAASAG
ncbi:GDSL-type esterase/lipase family protein [Yinghuangia sp. ASG 101]|uniref:GDSL-type esterase/lipase family protein n=1 Tax=Yinghuangia sp. ASG 101 TaxID=2896848 RepID=UPI001E58069C|nr:GDSL-type esterase/lipase family protein [Yinghuangia sp. ASG 101]UGQ13131.1 GDSL-type esterase/lipase family protein [Yinghuangia sp. ASG 101]